jgi:hypothetical protein
METIMRKTSWAAALLLGTLLLLSIGCSKKSNSTEAPGGGGDIGSVQVILNADTVDFFPGDSATVQGFVVVKDTRGISKPGVKISISLTPVLGYIAYVDPNLRDTTDANGLVHFLFKSYGQSGQTVVTATAPGDHTDSKTIVVRSAPSRIATLSLTLDRRLLEVIPSLEDSVIVYLTLADSSHAGIPNYHVILSATGGRYRQPNATDSTGRAVTMWYSNHQFSQGPSDFTITATAGRLTAQDTVTVHELPDVRGTLRVSTNTHRIRADRCNSTADLVAILQDSRGTAISGDTIRFSTPRIGNVTSYGVTDSMGRAHATFCAMDVPSSGPADSAVVVARYSRWSLVDSIHYYVAPVARVATVTLTTSSLQGIAGVDSASLTVRAVYDDGFRVSGIPVFFDRTCGRFTTDTMTLSNGTTPGTNYWHFCNQANTRAQVWCIVEDVTSDTLEFQVDPGPERRIRLLRDSSAIHIGSIVRIRAEVRDSLRNMVRSNVPVNFSSTIGTMSPPSPVATDNDGYAVAFLNSGTTGGPCTIKGTISSGTVVDSTVISIISGTAASIRIRVSNPSPEVHGAGGQDWSQIYADVFDANGNAVPDGQSVTFTIIGAPDGCNINGHGTVDDAQTANGTAIVTFNAGGIPGPVNISARATVGTNDISAQASIINVTAGPPASISVAVGNTGVDAGGAAWDLTVTAIVSDIYNNRVRDSIAVFFDVQPSYAQILSDTAYTGNASHRSGVAYTTMRFLSPNTNQTVQISARTAEPVAVSTSISYKLPAQNPTITLVCSPSNWHFPTQGDPCHINCRALVLDGHQIPINGCKVWYSPARGRMYPTDPTGTVTQFFQLTGPMPLGNPFETEDGHCTLWLRDLATNIFPDPNQVELNGDVTVEVEGYNTIDSQIINFRRGQGF